MKTLNLLAVATAIFFMTSCGEQRQNNDTFDSPGSMQDAPSDAYDENVYEGENLEGERIEEERLNEGTEERMGEPDATGLDANEPGMGVDTNVEEDTSYVE